MNTYVYICEDCGEQFTAECRGSRRLRKYCPACRHERHLARVREYSRKRSIRNLGERSCWAQRAAEDRLAESALRHCGCAKDPATFAWPRVFHGQPVVVEIRGQMTYAPAQLLGRLK